MRKKVLIGACISLLLLVTLSLVIVLKGITQKSEKSSVPSDAQANIQQDNLGVLNKVYIDYISSLSGDSVASVIAVIACSGTIDEIYSEPWVEKYLGELQYERGVRLKDVSTYDCTFMKFDKLAFQNLHIYESLNGRTKSVGFDELKVGDKIMSKSEINLMKPDTAGEGKNLIKTTIFRQ